MNAFNIKAHTQETGGYFPEGEDLFHMFGCFGDGHVNKSLWLRVCIAELPG